MFFAARYDMRLAVAPVGVQRRFSVAKLEQPKP
jgi:hypothetical protein